MSNVVSILGNEVIDPPALHTLGQSYDQALGILEASGSVSKEQREALAFKMLGLIKQGVTDSAVLTQFAVESFSEKKL